METNFDRSFDKMIYNEGGFVLHKIPGDRGGLTYAGISKNAHPSWAGWDLIDDSTDDLTNALLEELVKRFYKKKYWDAIKGDYIKSEKVAYHIFDFGVNVGIRKSVIKVQKIINVTVDGIFGDKTLTALNSVIEDEKDRTIFILDFCLSKISLYKDICLNDKRRKDDKIKSNLKFLCGWINRVERSI